MPASLQPVWHVVLNLWLVEGDLIVRFQTFVICLCKTCASVLAIHVPASQHWQQVKRIVR